MIVGGERVAFERVRSLFDDIGANVYHMGAKEAAVFCHEELGAGRLNGRHDLLFHYSVLGECLPLMRI